MKKNKGIFKTVFLLSIFMLLFLFCYKFLKNVSSFSFLSANSTLNSIYYCDDDSYILNNNMCFKYKMYNAYLLGDIDNNNVVNISDIEIIKTYIDNKKELSSIQEVTADVNADHVIDMDDVALMQENLKDNDTEIGKKYVCISNDKIDGNKCISEYSKEAIIKNVLKGDINQNNIIDNNDLYLIYNYINNNIFLTDVQLKIADINSDGKVDNKDFNWYKKNKLKKVNVDSNIKNINKTDEVNIALYKKNKNDNFYRYYFEIKNNNNYYYEWYLYSDDNIIEKSYCKKLENYFKLELNVEISGVNNYGKLNIYSDDKCLNKTSEYKTDTYHIKESIK